MRFEYDSFMKKSTFVRQVSQKYNTRKPDTSQQEGNQYKDRLNAEKGQHEAGPSEDQRMTWYPAATMAAVICSGVTRAGS